MIKSIQFFAFSILLLGTFAFTPVTENTTFSNDECSVEAMFAPCSGYIKLETSCFASFGTAPTITVTDPNNDVIYTGPANGYIPLFLILPGSYEIEISVPPFPLSFCSGEIGWEFCGGFVSNGGTPFTFGSGSPANFGFTIP